MSLMNATKTIIASESPAEWSVLYSPTLPIQVTITGQLALLMLIEAMEANGISVICANTDNQRNDQLGRSG